MSKYTDNFQLRIPESTDSADITQYNQNWEILESELSRPNRVYQATRVSYTESGNGSQNDYMATVPGLTELYNGLTITIVPDVSSEDGSGMNNAGVFLNVNNLGSKRVKMTLPFSSGNSGASATIAGWFSADAPMTLRYHEKMDCWKSDLQRQSAQTLYGVVPVENGGTGVTSLGALANAMGALQMTEVTYTGNGESELNISFDSRITPKLIIVPTGDEASPGEAFCTEPSIWAGQTKDTTVVRELTYNSTTANVPEKISIVRRTWNVIAGSVKLTATHIGGYEHNDRAISNVSGKTYTAIIFHDAIEED